MIEPLFIAPILGLLAKLVPVLGGVAAGVSAYQQIRESPGGLRVSPTTRELAPIPRTRSELERGAAYGGITRFEEDGAGGYYRARRRMNVLNPRALRRSIRRVRGFSRFASRVGAYTSPGRRYRLKGFGRKRARR